MCRRGNVAHAYDLPEAGADVRDGHPQRTVDGAPLEDGRIDTCVAGGNEPVGEPIGDRLGVGVGHRRGHRVTLERVLVVVVRHVDRPPRAGDGAGERALRSSPCLTGERVTGCMSCA